MSNLDVVLKQVLALDTADRVRLISKVTPSIEADLRRVSPKPAGYPSLWGICRGAEPVPSIEEFERARTEMWRSAKDLDDVA